MSYRPPLCPECAKDPAHQKTHGFVSGKETSPEDMVVNKEIWLLLEQHTATPGGVDGVCSCGDAAGWHPDHLVDLLVRKFELPWRRLRRYPW